MPVTGCFYWGDPCNSPEFDIAQISALINEENPDIVILDFEQWWSHWKKYDAACGGLIGWGDVPRFGPFSLSEHYRKVAQGIKAEFQNKKVLIYTSKPFVASWASPMSAWLHEFDGGFVASWPDYGKAVYYLDWEQIQAFPATDCVPDLPAGWSTWVLWQTSSRIRPKEYQNDYASGYDHNYDWGVFNGTVNELLVWAGKPVADPAPGGVKDDPPEPIPEPIPDPAAPGSASAWQTAIDAWARTLGFTGPEC